MEMSKKQYKLVIFDLDGTLLDTSEGILKSAKYTIAQLGYPEPSKELLYSFIGPRIQDSFQKSYGLQGETLAIASDMFRNQYKQGDVLLAKPYHGVYEVLTNLRQRGMHIAVATNKRQDFADELIEKYELSEYIDIVYGTDMKGKLCKNDLIYRCINHFPDSKINDTIMVGDSSYDAIAAQEVGVDFIGVRYGFDFKEVDDVNRWKNVGSVNTVLDILLLC